MEYENWWQHPSLLQDLTAAIEKISKIGYISDQTSAELLDVLNRARAAVAGYSNMGKIPPNSKMALTQLSDLLSMMQRMPDLKTIYFFEDGTYHIQIITNCYESIY